MQRLQNILSLKHHMGGYLEASGLQCREYGYTKALNTAQILYPGGRFPQLGRFTTVCSTHHSIYSERLAFILTEVIEVTYGEPIAASSGHRSSGSHSGRGSGGRGGF